MIVVYLITILTILWVMLVGELFLKGNKLSIVGESKIDKSLDGLKNLITKILVEEGCRSVGMIDVAIRAGGNSEETRKWRPLLRRVRLAAVHLQSQNLVTGIRKGKEVDIKTTKGVIRLQLHSSQTV